jgi:Lipid A 3-O-deacylase (PagL)
MHISHFRIHAFLCSFLVLISSFCVAQTQASSPAIYTNAERRGGNEFTFWGGYSPHSPQLIGVTEDRHLFMAGFGYQRVILASGQVAWKFTVDTVPVILVSQPTFAGVEISKPSQLPPVSQSLVRRRTTYGMGLMPVGFQLNFLRTRRIQPIMGINGGFGYFWVRQVPVPGSSNFNFMFSAGPGVQIFTGDARSITLGYRFYHISNADTGDPFNPGIDANFFYAGYSFHR